MESKTIFRNKRISKSFLLKYYILTAFIVFSGNFSAVSQITFQKIFGPGTEGNYISEKFDSTFICTLDSSGIYNVKITRFGIITWNKPVSMGSSATPSSIEPDPNGGYIFSGTLDHEPGTGVPAGFIAKLNSSGDTVWTQLFLSANNGKYGQTILPTLDDNYIFGIYEDGPSASNSSELIKIDPSQNVIWNSYIGTSGISNSGLIQDADSNFVVTHYDQVNLQNINYDKFSNIGDTLIQKTYQDSGSCLCLSSSCIAESKDGGYLVGGKYQNITILIKLDNNLDTVWTKLLNWGADNDPVSIALDRDSGYVVLLNYNGKINLYHIDPLGDSLELKSYNPMVSAYGTKMKRCIDGGYIIIGTTIDVNNINHAYVVKTDSLRRFSPQVTITSSGSTIFCGSGNITLSGPGGYDYFWSTGDTTQSIVVNQTGSYYLTVRGNTGNIATSNAINITSYVPVIPQITNQITYLQSTIANSYQWYLNGIVINGATHDTLVTTGTGSYTVVVYDTNNCISVSASYYYSWTGINGTENEMIKIFPVPASNAANIELPENFGLIRIRLKDQQNKIVKNIPLDFNGKRNLRLDTKLISDGIYFLEIENDQSRVVKKFVVIH